MRERLRAWSATSRQSGLRVYAIVGALLLATVLAWSRLAKGKDAADAVEASGSLRAAVGCPRATEASIQGKLASDTLDETSGLAMSRTQPGVVWVHNDSGDVARVFAIDTQGRLLAEVKLNRAHARDYEDIAIGPSETPGRDDLFVADIGDNFEERPSVQIYRFQEPRFAQTAAQQPQRLARTVQTIDVRYEDGMRDAEALLVDPTTRDLYIVEKAALWRPRAKVGVYRLPADEVRAGKVIARRVASLRLGPVTAGDVRADGSAVVVRNYWTALYWPRAAGETLAEVLARPGCELPLGDGTHQGESVGFLPDGSGYVTIPEGEHARIYRRLFVPNDK